MERNNGEEAAEEDWKCVMILDKVVREGLTEVTFESSGSMQLVRSFNNTFNGSYRALTMCETWFYVLETDWWIRQTRSFLPQRFYFFQFPYLCLFMCSCMCQISIRVFNILNIVIFNSLSDNLKIYYIWIWLGCLSPQTIFILGF